MELLRWSGRRRGVGRRLGALVALGALVVAAGACGSGDDGGSTAGGSGSPKKIAISFPNASQSSVVQALLSWAREAAAAKGYEIVVDDPGADLNKQVSTLKVWTQQRVPVIMSVVPDPRVFEGVARGALANDVKWITYAGRLQNQSATLGFEHREGGLLLGRAAAKWINEHLGGRAQVAILTFRAGEWARDREDAIAEILQQEAPGAEIVARQDAFSTNEGLNTTRTLLNAHPDLNVVLAITETASEGAYKAFLAAGHEPDDPNVMIGGIDGSPVALQLLDRGDTMYRVSVALDEKRVGEGIVELSDRLLAGGTGDLLIPFTVLEPGDPQVKTFLDHASAGS